ncbi:MAG: IclR family transcriptional regulator [Actinomycetes bacterium]
MTADTGEERLSRPASQTLHRGLLVLESLADRDEPQSVGEIAERLGLHRSIVYRVLRTLADHHLVRRHLDGRYGCSLGLVTLARSAFGDLEAAATSELSALADDVGATAFLAVPDESEVVTVASVEPRHTMAHVRYRTGLRQPLHRGAVGQAILAAGAARPGEPPGVARARQRGWASSSVPVLPGASAVAAGTVLGTHLVAAVGVVLTAENGSAARVAARVRQAARSLAHTIP